jgi:aminopeptidase N
MMPKKFSHRFAFHIFISLLLLGLSAQNVNAQIEYGKDVFHLLERESLKHQAKFHDSKQASAIDVHYYRCHWKINPEIKYIEGEVQISFIWTNSASTFDLDLSSALDVITVTHNSAPLNFIHANDRLRLIFDSVAEEGTLSSVSIKYQGTPVTTGFGSFVQYQTLSDGPIIWTLSQPFGAKDWWPCKQSLTDKADSIDIFIEHPSSYKAASNGLLQSITEIEQWSVSHWKHRYPIATYLIAVAVAGYNVYADYLEREDAPTLEVLNYVFPSWEEYARANTPLTVEMIALFEELFGPYPFNSEKYGHAQFAWGGGMEHQTMSFMGDFDIFLNSHELAHQWFGNTITCNSWNDIWINESLATFCTGLVFEFLRSEQEKLNWRKQYIDLTCLQDGGSVYVYNPVSTDQIFNFRLTYVKGAMVLNTLRYQLGDAVFFQALKNYMLDQRLRYGFAATDDIKRHFEEASNSLLDKFFDKWIYKEGYPVYEMFWFQQEDKTYLQINQQTSHPSVDFFELALPFTIVGENGQEKKVRLKNDFNRQVVELDTDFPVQEILFDPEHLILAKHEIYKAAELSPFDLDFILYPNPARDFFYIKPNRDGAYIKKLDLIGLDGRLLQSYEGIKSQSQPLMINVESGFPAGVYMLRITSNAGTYIKKLVLGGK